MGHLDSAPELGLRRHRARQQVRQHGRERCQIGLEARRQGGSAHTDRRAHGRQLGPGG